MTTAEIVKYIEIIMNIHDKYKLIEPEKLEIMVVRIACIIIVLCFPLFYIMITQKDLNYMQVVIVMWAVTFFSGIIVAFIGGSLEHL